MCVILKIIKEKNSLTFVSLFNYTETYHHLEKMFSGIKISSIKYTADIEKKCKHKTPCVLKIKKRKLKH